MYKLLIALFAGALFLAGCDLFESDDPEPTVGTVEAELNEQEWTAVPRAFLFYTEDAYEPQNDSLISMQFDAVRSDGFRHGALVVTFPFRGTGDYEIDHSSASVVEGGEEALDTLQANIDFFDTQHDAATARLGLEEDEAFRFTVTEFDRSSEVIRGTFSGSLVFQEGQPASDPVRNYPDQITFTGGFFEVGVEFVRATQAAESAAAIDRTFSAY